MYSYMFLQTLYIGKSRTTVFALHHSMHLHLMGKQIVISVVAASVCTQIADMFLSQMQ